MGEQNVHWQEKKGIENFFKKRERERKRKREREKETERALERETERERKSPELLVSYSKFL